MGLCLGKLGSNVSVGRFSILFNAVLYTICLIVFNPEVAIYSVVYNFLTSIVLDRMHQQNVTVQALIFTRGDEKALASFVMEKLGRGVTFWTGVGAYTGENVHVLCVCLSKYEIEELLHMVHSVDPHAFLTVQEGIRVFGNFPSQEDDVFIPLPLVEKSIALDLDPVISRISIGVDVARYGDDETVIAQNVGGVVDLPIIRRGQNLMRTVGDIVLQYRKLISDYPKYRGRIFVNIDDTGLGGGVTDRLAEVKREQHLSRLEIVPVNFGAKVPDQDAAAYFADITSYMWSNIRDQMEAGKLRLPNDTELVAQLSVRKYTVTSGGKIQLESKKDMKKRSIDSPDRADAVALTCFVRKIFDATSLIS